jgi:hypothetical protein
MLAWEQDIVDSIIAQFMQSAGPWAALAVILLGMNWERERREGKSVERSVELLTKTVEQVVVCVQANANKLDRITSDLAECRVHLSLAAKRE